MTSTLTPPAPARARRGRPPSISDEVLLDAARAVFLARGIRATTAEVAARANVSEGTLFHRYKTKDALFGAAMSFDPHDLPRMIERILPTKAEAERDLRGALIASGLRFVEHGRVMMPMMIMSWSNRNALDDDMLAWRKSMKARWTRGLKPMFDAAIARGELADVNSNLLVQMYLGTLRDFCVTELLDNRGERGERGERGDQDAHKTVEQLVTLVLRAAAP